MSNLGLCWTITTNKLGTYIMYQTPFMCTATRYTEAISLHLLKAKAVVKALIMFFSTFGFLKVIQTSQGTNCMSRLFKQVLSQLKIKHVISSAYGPDSQGALERLHQTLKSMLRLGWEVAFITVCHP